MAGSKVAVIGAGAAGLVTARELRRAGHAVTIFEQGDAVGGVWVYTPVTESDPLGRTGERIHSSLYESLRTNLPRDLMAFTDYPFDSKGGGRDEWPRFPGHACVREYLDNFADTFELRPLIRFGTQVVHVEPGDGWLLDSTTGHTLRQETFDAVAICNGHYSAPRVPELPGAAEFPGRLLHSHNYREPGPFTGQRVALVGTSASANDLAAELSGFTDAIFWCGEAFAATPAGALIRSGIQRLPPIAALGHDGSVRLVDDTVIPPIDALIFCTGYHYRYPFLAPGIVRVEDNWVQPLYRDLLHVEHSTLAFVGIPFRVVPFPLFEIQARWFARLLALAFELPSIDERRAETEARAAALRAAGIKQRHFHQRSLDCYEYLDPLSAQAGTPPLPDGRRQLLASFMAHAARHPASYRDIPLDG